MDINEKIALANYKKIDSILKKYKQIPISLIRLDDNKNDEQYNVLELFILNENKDTFSDASGRMSDMEYFMTKLFSDNKYAIYVQKFVDELKSLCVKNSLEIDLDPYNDNDILFHICFINIDTNSDYHLKGGPWHQNLMESFNGFASEEDYISLNESLNLKPALDKIKNICARLKKEFGLDCYATEDEVVFNNDDDIMSGLVVKKKYNNLKQYLANVFQVMKLCGRKISFDSQYDYNSILL